MTDGSEFNHVIRRFRITGKVQGVFFRHSTRLEAERLGLRGLARNLADGSVDVVAQGPPDAVEDLRRWLHGGPVQAQVASVSDLAFDERELDLPPSFEVR